MAATDFLEAAGRVPRGETRSFQELAALAGWPGAARAAGRVLGTCAERSATPWHRVVASNGALARDAARAEVQLRRLRREGARPRAGEAVGAWARRVGCGWVGSWRSRRALPADEARVDRWEPTAVEPLEDVARARARGFRTEGAGADVDDGIPRPPRLPVPAESKRAGRRGSPAERLARLDWDALGEKLVAGGHVRLPGLLTAAEVRAVLLAANDPARYERTIEMAPRGYGVGAYQYFREPLPEPLGSLRAELYARLLPAAERLTGERYPPTLAGLFRRARAAGQKRGACILIGYGPGGVNHPHRDLYGEVLFPFQAVLVLSRAGRDFDGGSFALYEEGRVLEVPATAGDAILFAGRERLDSSSPRRRTVPLRHGMTPVTRGARVAVGLVFPPAT